MGVSSLFSSVGKEALEKTAREAGEKALREAGEKGIKEAGEKALREAGEKAFREAAQKTGQEISQQALKEAGEKALKEAGEKGIKAAGETVIREGGEKVAKEVGTEVTEKVSKEVGTKAVSKLKTAGKYAAVTVAGLAAIGLGVEIYNKSKESFDKRNNHIFTIISIYNLSGISDGNISIKLANPDQLKMYVREDVELSNTDINISGRFEILKVNGDFTEILIKKVETLTKQGTKGDIKLFADQNNDVINVVEEGIKDVIDTVSDVTGLGALFESAKNGLIYFGIAVGVIGLLVLLGMIAKNVKSIRDLFSPPKKN
jgi:hypothetical protein